MSGLNLKEMEASNMVDVVHFLFEEDNTIDSEDFAKSQSALRTAVYSSMYKITYKYPYKSSKGQSSPQYNHSYDPSVDLGVMPEDEAVKPFNPREMQPETKAFVPATEFDPTAQNPFSGLLDAPLGH